MKKNIRLLEDFNWLSFQYQPKKTAGYLLDKIFQREDKSWKYYLISCHPLHKFKSVDLSKVRKSIFGFSYYANKECFILEIPQFPLKEIIRGIVKFILLERLMNQVVLIQDYLSGLFLNIFNNNKYKFLYLLLNLNSVSLFIPLKL